MLFTLLATVCLTVTVFADSDCSRTMLNDATGRYIAAQNVGSTASWTDLSNTVNYTENFEPMNINRGILGVPLMINHSVYTLDPDLCASFTELISLGSTPYVIATRLLFVGQEITTVESIVSSTGDWAFNATGYEYWTNMEHWDPIPKEKQDTREVIQAAGDAYFDRFDNVNVTVPFGTPCARLEGGAYTGQHNLTANTCNLGLPNSTKVEGRRYVVDVEMGIVDIFLGFPGLDRTPGAAPSPDSHFFRVEQGKIRYIHTVSTCANKGCGLNSTLGISKRRTIKRAELQM